MSRPRNPRPRTPRIIGRIVAVAAVLTAAGWALRPLPQVNLLHARSVVEPEMPVDALTDAPRALAALDDAAFHAPLWFIPPPPPAPAAPEPERPSKPPAPFKFELLAIVRGDSRAAKSGDAAAEPAPESDYKALFFDPERNKVVEVAAGDRLGGRVIVEITRRELRLQEGPGGPDGPGAAGTRTLTLRESGPARKGS